MIFNETIITRSDKTAWQMVEDKAVVVTPQTRKIHILSGCGSLIWQCLDKPRTPEEILKIICDAYDVDVAQAQKNIEDFIRQLKEKEIVLVEPSGL